MNVERGTWKSDLRLYLKIEEIRLVTDFRLGLSNLRV